jgi:hypothetical protein
LPLLRYRGIVRGMVPIPGRPVFDGCIPGGVVSLLNVSRVSSESSCSGISLLLSICCSASSSAIESRMEAAEGLLVSEEAPLAGTSYTGEVGPRENRGEIGLVTSDLLGLSMGGFEELGPPFPVLRGRSRACGGKTFLFGDGGDTGEGERQASSPGGGA